MSNKQQSALPSRLVLLSQYLALSSPCPSSNLPTPYSSFSKPSLQQQHHHSDDLCTSTDRLHQRAEILTLLYPSHPFLAPLMEKLSSCHHRLALLKSAIADQGLAVSKLSDAANLLLLIKDHVDLMTTYATSCTGGGWGEEEESLGSGNKGGCFKSDRATVVYLASVPANYRMRYLRKCWGFAIEAVDDAVRLSGFLSVRMGEGVVEELEGGRRMGGGWVELPGGLTFVFRGGGLRKMGCEAERLREVVMLWIAKQRTFVGRVRREVGKVRRKVGRLEEKMERVRRGLLVEEFVEGRGKKA